MSLQSINYEPEFDKTPSSLMTVDYEPEFDIESGSDLLSVDYEPEFDDNSDDLPGHEVPLEVPQQSSLASGKPALSEFGEGDVSLDSSPDNKKYNVAGGIKDIGKLFYDIPVNVMGAYASYWEDDNPEAKHDWNDIARQAQTERGKQRAAEPGGEEYVLPFIQRKDIRDASQSSGFSLVAMGAGALGAAAMTPIPVPGARITGGLAASGLAAYRMDKANFTQHLIDAYRQTKGGDVPPEEIGDLVERTKSLRNEHALWEAIPEAIGNAVALTGIGKLFTIALGEAVGMRVFKTLAGMYGAELTTETVTQTGQHNVAVDAGLQDGEKRSFMSPDDMTESFKEVAPQATVLTSLMSGSATIAGSVGKGVQNLMNKDTQEQPIIDTTPSEEPAGNRPFADLDQQLKDNDIEVPDNPIFEHEVSPDEVNTDPTDPQKKAGNYRKSHIKIDGMEISIENPEGAMRKGTSPDGTKWQTEMVGHYGYFRRSVGRDNDQVDVFVKPGTETSPKVFVVDQVDPETKQFDETKVILGAESEQEAKDLYMANYDNDWQGFGAIKEMESAEFKKWVKDKKQTRKPVALNTRIPVKKEQVGKKGTAYTNDNTPVDFTYAAVPLSQLNVSHDTGMKVNESYPAELQPRDRKRTASLTQVQNIAKNLNPAKLTNSSSVGNGAPIVLPDMTVLSGNGRSIALRLSSQYDTGKQYQQYIRENQKQFGIKDIGDEDIALVRIVDSKKIGDLQQFVQKANESETARMSASEQAVTDAKNFTVNDLDIFHPSEDGDVTATSNLPFLKRFIKKLPPEEQSGLLAEDGAATKQLVDRVQSAVFQKAYESEQLLKLMAEAANPDMRNLLNGLQAGATEFAKAKSLNNEIATEAVDILTEGVNFIRQAQKQYADLKGGTLAQVEHAIAQKDLFEQDASQDVHIVALDLASNIRSGKRIGEYVKAFGHSLRQDLSDIDQQNLFDDKEPVTPSNVLAKAKRRIAHEQKKQNHSKGNQDSGQGDRKGYGQDETADTGTTKSAAREERKVSKPSFSTIESVAKKTKQPSIAKEQNRIEREGIKAGANKLVAQQTAQIAVRMARSFADRSENHSASEILKKLNFDRGQVQVDGEMEYNQQGQLKTDTENFKKWFEESKVVDESGQPLVVYHGSAIDGYVDTTDFTEFSKDSVGDRYNADTIGFFFTNVKNFASQYATSPRDYKTPGASKGAVYPVYVSLQNPLIVDSAFLQNKNITPIGREEDSISFWDNYQSQILGWVAEGEYDGIILKDEINQFEGEPSQTVIAFEPTQIKSISNEGTFDPDNPNILKQNTSDPKGTVKIFDDRYIISLLENADASTPFHELAHVFYNEMEMLVQQGAATEGLQKDYDTLNEWMGDLDPVGRQEKFARGFEAYLMTGKAPTAELESAFKRFVHWFKEIYKHVKALGVKLTPEITKVYDRMLTAGQYQSVKDIQNSWRSKGIENWITEKDGKITLSKIKVPKDKQQEGIGTNAMQELVRYADATNQTVFLTPTKEFGAKSISRLKHFYTRLGFKKNSDPAHSESMFRPPNIQFSTDTLPGDGVSIKDIQKRFKGQEVFISPDKTISIHLKNGMQLKIHQVKKISDEDIEFAIAIGRMSKDGIVLGKYQDDKITLNKTMATQGTLDHEVYHWLVDNGLISKGDRAVIRAKANAYNKEGRFGFPWNALDKENEANAFAQFLSERESFRDTRLGTILQKVRDFLDALWYIGRQSVRKIARQVEAGKIYDDKVKQGMSPVAASYAATAETFYSQMQEVLSKKLNKSGTPAAFKQQIESLAKKGEFKQEELEWSGLLDWLDEISQDSVLGAAGNGTKKVTKQEVIDFIKQNDTVLNNTVLDETHLWAVWDNEAKSGVKRVGTATYSSVEEAEREMDKLNQTEPSYVVEIDPDMSVGEDVVYAIIGRMSGELKDTGFETREEAEKQIKTIDADPSEERYSVDKDFEAQGNAMYSDYQLSGGNHYRETLLTLSPKEKTIKTVGDLVVYFEKLTGKDRQDISIKDLKGVDDELIVIWMEDYRGKKDLQKEINKTVKETAYRSAHWNEPNVLLHVRSNERTDINNNSVLFLEEVQSDLHQEGKRKGYKPANKEALEKRRAELEAIGHKNKKQEIETSSELKDEWIDIMNQLQPGRSAKVPNFPFKKTWPLLAIKKMVRQAAEKGLDYLAWTSGEVQADRYDLSKQIDTLQYTKDGQGVYGFNGNKNNVTIISQNNVSEAELHRYVGKELAAKMIAGEGNAHREGVEKGTKEFSGLDLQIGGTGMKGFYDKILPAEVNKFFNKKAWGKAKVTQIEIPVDGENVKVWALPITPEIKQKALYKGMPLFQAQDSVPSEKALKEFEKTSKIPYPVYHGSMEKFDEIKTFLDRDVEAGSGNPSSLIRGFYFANKLSIAEEFGEHTQEIYVDSKKPLVIDYENSGLTVIEVQEAILEAQAGLESAVDDYVLEGDLQDFDAIVIKGADYVSDEKFDEIIVPEENLNILKTKDKLGQSRPQFQTSDDIIKEKFYFEPSLKEKIKDVTDQVSVDRATTETLDHLHFIKARLGDRAYRLHRRTTGVSTTTYGAWLKHGGLVIENDGSFNTDKNHKGVLPFLNKLGKEDANKLVYWVSAKRAESLASETVSREKWLDADARTKIFQYTGNTTSDGKTWASQNMKFQKYNNNILDFAEKAGLIDKDARKEWQSDFYISFNRVLEKNAHLEALYLGPKNNNQHISSQIQRLKGGEAKIDPLTNLFRNWMFLLDASSRNIARAKAFDVGIQLPASISWKIVNQNNSSDIQEFTSEQDALQWLADNNGYDVNNTHNVGQGVPYAITKQIKTLLRQVSKSEITNLIGVKKNIKWAVSKKNEHRIVKTFPSKREAQDWIRQSTGNVFNPATSQYEIEKRQDTSVMFGKMRDFGILSFQRNGKPVYFTTEDRDLYDALAEINLEGLDNIIVDFAASLKRILTFGITRNPIFATYNFIRDTKTSSVIDRDVIPVYSQVQGVVKFLIDDDDAKEFAASGWSFGSSYVKHNNIDHQAKYLKKIVDIEGKGALNYIINTPKKLWNLYEFILEASEVGPRLGGYVRKKKKGKSHFDAGFEVRDWMDFSMHGKNKAVLLAIRVLPFLNARGQGLYKTAKVFNPNTTTNPDFGIIAIKAALFTGAALTLWYTFKDDDRYKQLQDWDKWFFHHAWIGDHHIRIPVAFEVGTLLGILPTVIGDMINNEEEGKYFWDFFSHTLKNTFAFDIDTQITKVPDELKTNINKFTKRKIVPEGIKKYEPHQQFTESTSYTAREFAKQLNKLNPGINLSPIQFDHAVRGYLGRLGSAFLLATDVVVQGMFDYPEKPEGEHTALSFGLVDRVQKSNKYVTRFYELQKEINELHYTLQRIYINTAKKNLMGRITETDRRLLEKQEDESTDDYNARMETEIERIMNDYQNVLKKKKGESRKAHKERVQTIKNSINLAPVVIEYIKARKAKIFGNFDINKIPEEKLTPIAKGYLKTRKAVAHKARKLLAEKNEEIRDIVDNRILNGKQKAIELKRLRQDKRDLAKELFRIVKQQKEGDKPK
jgi:hypothetical protein